MNTTLMLMWNCSTSTLKKHSTIQIPPSMPGVTAAEYTPHCLRHRMMAARPAIAMVGV